MKKVNEFINLISGIVGYAGTHYLVRDKLRMDPVTSFFVSLAGGAAAKEIVTELIGKEEDD